jgi:hypothetical protein
MRLPLLVLPVLLAAAPAWSRAADGEAAPAAPDGSPPPAAAPAAEVPPATVATPAAVEAPATVAAPPAETAAGASATADAAAPPAPEEPSRLGPLPRWGMAFGAGFPDFATASVMYRPLPFLRLAVGPSWNTVGWGLHGGVELAPWSGAVTPVLAFHAGKFLRSDYSRYANEEDDGSPSDVKPLLERLDYSYAGIDLGLDFGNPRGFSVALRLGVSFVSVSSPASATFTNDQGSIVTLSRPDVDATLPSAKLALQYWF